MTETVEQEILILQNESAAEKDRVQAAHVLGRSGSQSAAEALVQALDGDDYGVHWAASEGLAQLGDVALPVLLKVLVSPTCSPRVRDGAKHVFHASSSENVRAQTKELLRVMHGPTEDINTMKAASDLLMRMSKN